jgi:serine phosphatase RsbU (regulator of sigma subunit)
VSSEKTIRIAVASDQAIFRRGLVSLITSIPSLKLVGEARDIEEAVQLCDLIKPDVLLLDLKNLPEQAKNWVSSIHKRFEEVKIVFLYSVYEENQYHDNLEDERVYYFSKDITEEEFEPALRDIVFSSSPAARELPGKPSEGSVNNQVYAGEERGETRDRELKMAGRIQADIMPEKAPVLPGWEVSAVLKSARETSGDFYDFIQFDRDRWGIVVADVTDKGIGAALFMALSSTLIRTYAGRYPTLPALTMNIVNDRILKDTRGSMFVSAFYGVLEPELGRLRYANAGHPPAMLTGIQKGKRWVDRLPPTGMALGMIENAHWRQKVIKFSKGDVLLLYTDGITEAENSKGHFFGEQRLIELLRSKGNCPASEIQHSIITEVENFVGSTSHLDDIALIVLKRKSI